MWEIQSRPTERVRDLFARICHRFLITCVCVYVLFAINPARMTKATDIQTSPTDTYEQLIQYIHFTHDAHHHYHHRLGWAFLLWIGGHFSSVVRFSLAHQHSNGSIYFISCVVFVGWSSVVKRLKWMAFGDSWQSYHSHRHQASNCVVMCVFVCQLRQKLQTNKTLNEIK